MSSPFKRVVLHSKRERSLLLRHPWVFSGAVKHVDDMVEEGEIVEVFSSEGKYLATGHFHEGSIKVRIFSFEQTDAGPEFWNAKLRQAIDMRDRIGLLKSTHTNAFRLVHAEGDGLPGLIIDIYHRAAVLQFHTPGMHAQKEVIAKVLDEQLGGKLDVIYNKSSESLGKQGALGMTDTFLKGSEPSQTVKENGIMYHVNYVEGQKTGFFLDQRDNRQLLKSLSGDRTVLNTFSYSGGFSMASLAGGAKHVISVDSSSKATRLAVQNAELNSFQNHEIVTDDVFHYLKSEDSKYDIVILDPPAFAKHLSAVDQATVGYRNLNLAGFKKVERGGLLFTFSCSQVIDKNLFRKIVFQAAAQSGRNVRILHQLSQGADHPVSIYHPEGEYLKGLVLYVD